VLTERDNPCLIRRQFQPELGEPLTQLLVEPFGVVLMLERGYKIIREPNQARLAPTAGFDHFVKP